jgi:hypothetical protein
MGVIRPPALANWKPHAILFPSPFAVKSPAADDGKSAGKMASPPCLRLIWRDGGPPPGPQASRSCDSQLLRAYRRNGSAAAGEGWPPQSCTPRTVCGVLDSLLGGSSRRTRPWSPDPVPIVVDEALAHALPVPELRGVAAGGEKEGRGGCSASAGGRGGAPRGPRAATLVVLRRCGRRPAAAACAAAAWSSTQLQPAPPLPWSSSRHHRCC